MFYFTEKKINKKKSAALILKQPVEISRILSESQWELEVFVLQIEHQNYIIWQFISKKAEKKLVQIEYYFLTKNLRWVFHKKNKLKLGEYIPLCISSSQKFR